MLKFNYKRFIPVQNIEACAQECLKAFQLPVVRVFFTGVLLVDCLILELCRLLV
jgi:hypothetical protein